jgi:hypothetical protein
MPCQQQYKERQPKQIKQAIQLLWLCLLLLLLRRRLLLLRRLLRLLWGHVLHRHWHHRTWCHHGYH